MPVRKSTPRSEVRPPAGKPLEEPVTPEVVDAEVIDDEDGTDPDGGDTTTGTELVAVERDWTDLDYVRAHVISELNLTRVPTGGVLPLIEIFASAVARWHQARAEIDKAGGLLLRAGNVAKAHPLLHVETAQAMLVLRYADALALTPMSRAKLGIMALAARDPNTGRAVSSELIGVAPQAMRADEITAKDVDDLRAVIAELDRRTQGGTVRSTGIEGKRARAEGVKAKQARQAQGSRKATA